MTLPSQRAAKARTRVISSNGRTEVGPHHPCSLASEIGEGTCRTTGKSPLCIGPCNKTWPEALGGSPRTSRRAPHRFPHDRERNYSKCVARPQEKRSEANRLTPRRRARPLHLSLRQTNGRAPHMNPGARPPSRRPKGQPWQVNTHGSTTRPLGANNGSLSESASRRALQHRRGHT